MASRANVPFRTRFATSRAIFRQGWGMLRHERDLWLFPTLASVTMLLGMLPFVLVPMWVGPKAFGSLFHALGPAAPFSFILLLPLFYPFAVLASLFNAALCFAAHERLEGRPGAKREAWRRALGQIGPIARFNLLAMLVSGALALVGQLLERLRIVPYLGRAVQVAGGLAWAAASYFVIPVLAVEGERSALGALRTSVGLAREQWGKATTGLVTVGLVVAVPMTVLMLLLVPVFVALFVLGPTPGVIAALIAIGVLFFAVLLGLGGLSTALGALYQTALYRYARTGIVSLPYTPETLVDAWAPYRKD